jgi:hypothetical protein
MSYTISGEMVPITVNMPFTLDVSGIEAELFGEEIELSGEVIIVGTGLGLSNLFESDPSGGKAWLHYLQGEDEDNFDVYVNREKSADLAEDISGALEIGAGATYDEDLIEADRENMDASAVFSNSVGSYWQKYKSLQDFVISWYANKILGHPGALAAISNDAHIRSQTKVAFDAGITAVHGQDANALMYSQLARVDDRVPEQSVADRAIGTGGVDGDLYVDHGMSGEPLQMIVQQMMSMNPGRFNLQDRGFLQPVRWIVGDKLRVQLAAKGASYRVASNPTNTTRAPVSAGGYTNVLTGNKQNPTTGPISIDDENFVLEFEVV